MKALVWTEPEKMVLTETPFVPPAADEVAIRVESVGICGSEIEGFLGHNSLRVPPLIMGHEFCGVVHELGASVTGLEKGQRVTVNPLIHCGKCRRCLRGTTNLCDGRQIIGIHRSGAFAQYVLVPGRNVHPVPASLPSTRAALAEPLACAWRATRRALQEAPYANVLVIGAGAIGLLSALSAKILGARKVILTDTNQERLQSAANAGIDYTVQSGKQDLPAAVRDIAGEAGIDVVIDAAGFQPTRSAAMEILNAGGTLMNIGLGIDETNLKVNDAIRREINMLGSFCYSQQDFSDALNLLIDGSITEDGWSEVRPMSEGQSAFEQLVQGKVAKAKIFLEL